LVVRQRHVERMTEATLRQAQGNLVPHPERTGTAWRRRVGHAPTERKPTRWVGYWCHQRRAIRDYNSD